MKNIINEMFPSAYEKIMIISVVSSLMWVFYLLDDRTNKKEPKQQECVCTSSKEVIMAYEQYHTYIDSLSFPRYKKQYPRYRDSLTKINLILSK